VHLISKIEGLTSGNFTELKTGERDGRSVRPPRRIQRIIHVLWHMFQERWTLRYRWFITFWASCWTLIYVSVPLNIIKLRAETHNECKIICHTVLFWCINNNTFLIIHLYLKRSNTKDNELYSMTNWVFTKCVHHCRTKCESWLQEFCLGRT